MVAKKKKIKLSKGEKKKLLTEKGAKGAEARGLGLGSCKNFSLAANWREEPFESGGKAHLRFVSPGKTKYATQMTVKKELASRNLSACLHYQFSSSEDQKSDN